MLQASTNQVRGLRVHDIVEDGYTNLVFESDRVNLKQINELVQNYKNLTSVNLFDGLMFITSTTVNTGKFTGRETFARGERFEPAITMEIPKSSRYGPQEVKNAFTFVGRGSDFGLEEDIRIGDPSSVNLDDSIIITPKFDKKFRLSDGNVQGSYHNQAADDLKLNLSDVSYAGQVLNTGTKSILNR
jgi:hypothetical protein